MTYNILEGAVDRIDKVVAVINKAHPDVLIVNEANDFDANDYAVLHHFADLVKLPYYYFEKNGDEWIYPVVIFSKYPFIEVEALKPVTRGIICATLRYHNQPITIVGLHLSPFSESERLNEAALLLSTILRVPRLVVMGDFNSLSPKDVFTDEQLKTLPESYRNKFAQHGVTQYDVYEFFAKSGLIDVALQFNDLTNTIPTLVGETAHPPTRLDRALVSSILAPVVTHYEVIKNSATNKASDHYPVVIDINV
jgi:endonuclease/exonuclease/phosphatase family metal-dependent hydrolase